MEITTKKSEVLPAVSLLLLLQANATGVCLSHGRNEVRWRPGQEAGLSPLCSKLRSSGSKYCIEESTCDIVGTFRRLHSHSTPPVVIRRPGNCSPLAPLVTPLVSPETQGSACYMRVTIHCSRPGSSSTLGCYSQLTESRSRSLIRGFVKQM